MPRPPSTPPGGPHIAYWRTHAKSDPRHAPPLPPLDPLTPRQITGLITVCLLILSLISLSVAWWLRDVAQLGTGN